MYCIGLFIFFPVSVRVRKVEFAGSEGLVALLDMMDSPLSGLYYFVFPHILREGQFPSPYYFPLSMVLSLGTFTGVLVRNTVSFCISLGMGIFSFSEQCTSFSVNPPPPFFFSLF